MCEVVLPDALASQLDAAGTDNPDAVAELGTQWALRQVEELLAGGAPGYHLYTLNQARSALAFGACGF